MSDEIVVTDEDRKIHAKVALLAVSQALLFVTRMASGGLPLTLDEQLSNAEAILETAGVMKDS